MGLQLCQQRLAAALIALLTFSLSAAWATPVTFNFTGTFQTFTVPAAAIYQITAFGAQGGGGPTLPGGLGAEISGDFMLTQGEVLQIAVAGAGVTGGGSGGGGGGSFVVGPGNMPLVIAGGGGGAGFGQTGGGQGLAIQSGGDGGNSPGNRGQGGNGGGGGLAGAGGGGGGGFNGNGVNGTDGNAGSGGVGYPGGLAGGVGVSGTGGFGGGGGGGAFGGGGGGGYSGGGGGGGGGLGTPGFGGGGGGSFFGGLNNADMMLIPGVNTANGSVVISAEAVFPPIPPQCNIAPASDVLCFQVPTLAGQGFSIDETNESQPITPYPLGAANPVSTNLALSSLFGPVRTPGTRSGVLINFTELESEGGGTSDQLAMFVTIAPNQTFQLLLELISDPAEFITDFSAIFQGQPAGQQHPLVASIPESGDFQDVTATLFGTTLPGMNVPFEIWVKSDVPEPSSLSMFLIGLAGMIVVGTGMSADFRRIRQRWPNFRAS